MKREIYFEIKSRATTPEGISRAIWKNVDGLQEDEFTPEAVKKMLITGEIVADGNKITTYADVC